MIDIYSYAKDALSILGVLVKQQGTFATGETPPESFVTYQVIDSPSNSFADGEATSITYRVQVSYYSKRPALVQSAEPNIRQVMKANGFMRIGGRDLPFDSSTGHYGYTCDYRLYDSEV